MGSRIWWYLGSFYTCLAGPIPFGDTSASDGMQNEWINELEMFLPQQVYV